MIVTGEEIISAAESGGITVDLSNVKVNDLLSDAGIDSLEMMTFLLGIEEKYGVKFPDEDIDSLSTVDNIIAYMERF